MSGSAATLAPMAHRICWHCDVKTHMTMIEGSQRAVHSDTSNDMWLYFGTFLCDQCRYHSLLVVLERYDYRPSAEHVIATLEANANGRWLPNRGIGKDFADVPPHIAEAASEAHSCHSINAYRASTLLARSVIEATAKHEGIAAGSLFEKIDALAAQGKLRAHIKEAAHEIRQFGNDMAHGDFIQKVDEEESALVLTLMGEVLDDVYQSPARVRKAKAARAAKAARED